MYLTVSTLGTIQNPKKSAPSLPSTHWSRPDLLWIKKVKSKKLFIIHKVCFSEVLYQSHIWDIKLKVKDIPIHVNWTKVVFVWIYFTTACMLPPSRSGKSSKNLKQENFTMCLHLYLSCWPHTSSCPWASQSPHAVTLRQDRHTHACTHLTLCSWTLFCSFLIDENAAHGPNKID